MNRYEIIIDATDVDALLAIDELFTNITFTPVPESSIMTYVTFDANDDAITYYADRFDIPTDEIDDVFTLVD
jgi:hypothetical protein